MFSGILRTAIGTSIAKIQQDFMRVPGNTMPSAYLTAVGPIVSMQLKLLAEPIYFVFHVTFTIKRPIY